MRTVLLVTACTALLAGIPSPAAAQETGKAGVVIGYPADIGVLWHVSDAVAIRPSVSFNHGSTDTPENGHNWGAAFDLGVVFYVKKYDHVRTYVSPRFTYARTSMTTTPALAETTVEVTSTGSNKGVVGTFGAQYAATPHFSLYGEAGVGYSRRSSEFSGPFTSQQKTAAWGSVAGVGVVFYP